MNAQWSDDRAVLTSGRPQYEYSRTGALSLNIETLKVKKQKPKTVDNVLLKYKWINM